MRVVCGSPGSARAISGRGTGLNPGPKSMPTACTNHGWRLGCTTGERRACGGVRRMRQGSCVRGWLIEKGGGGGGSFLWCMWATEGTPGSRRVARGENSLL